MVEAGFEKFELDGEWGEEDDGKGRVVGTDVDDEASVLDTGRLKSSTMLLEG